MIIPEIYDNLYAEKMALLRPTEDGLLCAVSTDGWRKKAAKQV